MKVTITHITPWSLVKTAALATIGKHLVNEPDEDWIKTMLASEHSPIRCKQYWIEMSDIPYYVAMHLVRHKHGVEWFCNTSREDRTGVPRSSRKQTDLVTLSCLINAQAVMTISRRRLCSTADKETRKLWTLVKREMYHIDRPMAYAMMPQCLYTHSCNEPSSCGLWRSKK